MTKLEELQLERKQEIAQIEREYGELIAKSASGEEAALLNSAKKLELKTAELSYEKEAKELRDSALSGIRDEIGLLKARVNGTEDVYLLEKAIKDLADGSGGTINEQEARALVTRKKALESQLDSMQQVSDLAQSIGDSIQGGILDSINAGIDALVNGTEDLDKALQKIAQGVLADIGQQLIKFGISSLFNSIGGGGAGGIFGGLFRAEGGPVAGGQPYIVGEKGPELFIPGVLERSATTTSLRQPARQ